MDCSRQPFLCHFCKKPNHKILDCRILRERLQNKIQRELFEKSGNQMSWFSHGPQQNLLLNLLSNSQFGRGDQMTTQDFNFIPPRPRNPRRQNFCKKHWRWCGHSTETCTLDTEYEIESYKKPRGKKPKLDSQDEMETETTNESWANQVSEEVAVEEATASEKA